MFAAAYVTIQVDRSAFAVVGLRRQHHLAPTFRAGLLWGMATGVVWLTGLAERCQLFLIVAIGESLLVIGTTLSGTVLTASVITAFVVAFAGSVALWWIYFDRVAGYGSAVLTAARDPGRVALRAYTYAHVPIVAGIIVCAVADELSISHPDASWLRRLRPGRARRTRALPRRISRSSCGRSRAL